MLAIVLSLLMSSPRERDEKGATAVEYALVIGLVSLVVVGAVTAFGPAITAFISTVSFR